MKKQYVVELTPQERKLLTGIVKRGKGPAYRVRHAYVLLHAVTHPKDMLIGP
jgi:hypothetical protein